ncbi:putative ribosome biogenesis protein Pescadillo [Elsinoe ampelina]|uniref:Pescadillo homolog n=1 Tax=Elsinoe ampelina TaxID=302913 RepID=A0A6A6G0D6_9PEZI|nr:putative ribosome biogenesis protein Pescadillo [Elsinoe ampelina]
MARIKKRGTSGQAKNYITRTQAVRKLQLSLPDFRRLCIFKGIYPREPRNRKKASKSATHSTTFYYTKDIQYLLHEPLLAKFRDHKALGKKIARALGKNEVASAQRLERNLTPRMTLDHIIKERYPTFVDALRDLDDALSMLFLFANLPQTDTVSPKIIALCQRLCSEFEHYIIRTNSLRKSFLSIKGIYYQATIQGQDILWLVPYKFVQRVTGDVDFRIMGTFVEFYTTLLGFVNYRLYTSIGLVYPPKFDVESDEKGGELGAFRLENQNVVRQPQLTNGHTNGEVPQITSEVAQAEADKLLTSSQPDPTVPASSYETAPETTNNDDPESTSNEIDTFAPIDPTADTLLQPSISTSTVASLFAPFTFFLARETPRHPIEFLLRSFGCKRVGWDAILGDGSYVTDETDKRITHQVVDRPDLPLPEIPAEDDSTETPRRLRPGERVPGRVYIQPQWVWDCINAGKLLRTDLYAPGAVLPPHLSPFVKARKGEYDPTKPLAEQEEEGEREAAAEIEAAAEEEMEDEDEDMEADDEKTVDKPIDRDADVETGEGMDVELGSSGSEDDDEEEQVVDEEWTGLDSDASDGETDNLSSYQRELEAEASGRNTADAGSTPAKGLKNAAQKKREKQKKEQQEETDRQKMMLSRRKRKLFEKMQYSNNKRDEQAEKLRGKRRRIEGKGT